MEQVSTSGIQGLSEQEVLVQRARGLGSIPPPSTGRSHLQIILETVFTPITSILFLLCAALVFLGQVSDGLVSAGVVFFNVVVSIIQEMRAKYVLDRITLLTRPQALVVREGQERTLDPGELVANDVLIISVGDQVVADGPLIEGGPLEIDESLLTGESTPVRKQEGDPLYSGTSCLSGKAYYRAEKLGVQSVAGKLTASARAYKREYTPLQRQMNLAIRGLFLVAFCLEGLLVVGALTDHRTLPDIVRMSVVIIGIVPIGLLLASTVAYALGALRLARQGILVQHLGAIESLSHVDILCLDKTGTLTTKEMHLEEIHPFGIEKEALRTLLGSYSMSLRDPNATSRAIEMACTGQDIHPFQQSEEIPFSSARKWSALVVDDEAFKGNHVLGAPEVLLPHLQAEQETETLVRNLATQGSRVLCFAFSPDRFQMDQEPPQLPAHLSLRGILSLHGELRTDVQKTLSHFAELGVQLKVISGDHPETVRAIAKQVGLGEELPSLSGQDLAHVSEEDLDQIAEKTIIFGRVTPEQKEQLILALRRRHHYVAMVGDGVNDVLSMKQAHLSIALQSGSQAPRGIADLVLLHDSFGVLPHTFAEGQRIQNGMHTNLQLFLTRALLVAFLMVTTALVGGFPFVPKQNVLLSLLTVGIPAIALAAWARPGDHRKYRWSQLLLHFVIPAALTMSIFASTVYLKILFPQVEQKDTSLAQSTLTTFVIFCGLITVLFAAPPVSFLADKDVSRSNWKPTFLGLVLLISYLIILNTPPVLAFFDLLSLDRQSYFSLGEIALLWALVFYLVRRFSLLERFLLLDQD
jgi:cation-transporting ATPase E